MFLLLRHGETNYNLERRYQGGSQLPYLTSLGRQQVAAASKLLKKIHISHVFCSPLKRAQETFEVLHALLPALPNAVTLDELTEPSIPEWLGLPKKDIQKEDPIRLGLWRERPWEFICHDGSSPLSLLYTRIRDLITNFNSLEATTLIIGHDHVDRAIISSLLGLPITAHVRFPQTLGALSAVANQFLDFGRSLVFSNIRNRSTEHSPPPSSRLILIRHGSTDATESDVFQGVQLNLGLNSEGRNQANQHVDFFKTLNAQLIISSTLKRAVETAEHLSLGAPIIRDQGLDEFDYGDWSGKTRQEIKRNRRTEYESWIRLSSDSPVSSGESLEHFINRIGELCNRAWHQAELHGTVVIVSHEIVLRLLLALSLELPVESLWRFQFDHVCFSELRKNSLGQVQLTIHNLRPGESTQIGGSNR
jgi:phosphoserine phosphatase